MPSGPPDTPTVHCVSLQRGSNCTSKVVVEWIYDYFDPTPPPMTFLYREMSDVKPPPPAAPLLMFLHLANKSPGFFAPRPASSVRHPRVGLHLWGWVWFQKMMPRPAWGSVSIMLTWLMYVKDICFENTSAYVTLTSVISLLLVLSSNLLWWSHRLQIKTLFYGLSMLFGVV